LWQRARCFLAFVRAQGLTSERVVTVQTMTACCVLMQADDRVTVDMGAPCLTWTPFRLMAPVDS
jgi:diaminopimelate epimerase